MSQQIELTIPFDAAFDGVEALCGSQADEHCQRLFGTFIMDFVGGSDCEWVYEYDLTGCSLCCPVRLSLRVLCGPVDQPHLRLLAIWEDGVGPSGAIQWDSDPLGAVEELIDCLSFSAVPLTYVSDINVPCFGSALSGVTATAL